MPVFATATRTPTLLLSRALRRPTLLPASGISALYLKAMSSNALSAAISHDHAEVSLLILEKSLDGKLNAAIDV
jgi:hypothetical protein